MANLLFFFVICVVASFVCTAIGEEDVRTIIRRTLRLLGMMILGIAAFCLVIHLLTWAA